MTKRMVELQGRRVFNAYTGAMGRITEVRPHGQTSQRFVVTYDDGKPTYELTHGELLKNWEFVPEGHRHNLPPEAARVRALIAVIDEKCEGRLSYRPQHFTCVSRWTKDSDTLRPVKDGFTLSAPFGDDTWRLDVSLWGGTDYRVEALRAEVDASGGLLWPVFKPKLVALANRIEKGTL